MRSLKQFFDLRTARRAASCARPRGVLLTASSSRRARVAQGDLTGGVGQFAAVQPKKEKAGQAARPQVREPPTAASVPRVNAAHEQLLRAASDGNLQQARTAITAGANVNCQGKSGLTPLMQAANAGSAAVVTLLLERGADLNASSTEAAARRSSTRSPGRTGGRRLCSRRARTRTRAALTA